MMSGFRRDIAVRTRTVIRPSIGRGVRYTSHSYSHSSTAKQRTTSGVDYLKPDEDSLYRSNYSHQFVASPAKNKKGKKPPKSGKGKLSKSEKDKLKQEEEEKRLQEEEEEKQQKAKQAADQAEREKAEAEERKRLEAEEAKRRKVQLEELNDLIHTIRSQIASREDVRRKNAKWERYMRCDGSADPTVAGEINTYINLQREDKSNKTIDAVLRSVEHTRELVEELEFILEDTPQGDLRPEEVTRYQQTIVELEQLVNNKLDAASHDLTLQATELMNSETLNLQVKYDNDDIRLYIWGNLSKNPRIKLFEFPDGAVSFNIPKLLTLSDCGYRCLFTRFDHYSHLSGSFLPRLKEPAAPTEPQEPSTGEGEVNDEEKTGEGEGDEDKEEPGAERENTQDLMEMLDNPDKLEEEDEEETKETAEEDIPDIIEDDLVKTPEPVDFEEFDGDDEMVDLRAYRPLGGIFKFNLLHMPPQPKQVKNWTITQKAEPSIIAEAEPPHLHYYDYVADDVAPPSEVVDEKAQGDDDTATKKEERPAINIQLRLPDEYFFFEDPLVARWDEEKRCWRQDGFMDTSFVEETRRLTFKTCYFGTFALMQDVHINMPFQSWEIRPKGLNNCLFTLIAAIVELEIEVKDAECCLRAPADRKEVAHLRGKWLPLRKFIQAMKSSGVNIFPSEDSHKYVTVQEKNSIAEHKLYEQMALTASAMAYSWSKWNGEQSADKLVLQGAPQLVDEPLTEDDWSLFMVTRKRTMKLRMSEFDETFSEDFAEGTEFHADMYHMALQLTDEVGQQRIRESSQDFCYTMMELLKSTRFLIYA